MLLNYSGLECVPPVSANHHHDRFRCCSQDVRGCQGIPTLPQEEPRSKQLLDLEASRALPDVTQRKDIISDRVTLSLKTRWSIGVAHFISMSGAIAQKRQHYRNAFPRRG